MTRWRLIDSGPLPAATNMALDAALLARHGPHRPPILRCYGWQPAAVTLGQHQRPESVDLAACRRLGLQVARRPTGGGAVLHEVDEVTLSVVISLQALGVGGVMTCYRALSAAIAAGLQRLGVAARLVDAQGEPQAGPSENPVCFARRARCDLAVDGRKLVGSAQAHRRGLVLQQSSLPASLHLDRLQALFGGHAAAAAAALTLRAAAGRPVPYPEACQAIAEGFAQVLQAHFLPSAPDGEELALAASLLPAYQVLA